jgi:TRAP-type C4-dicarboxylate transport system permease small subunit
VNIDTDPVGRMFSAGFSGSVDATTGTADTQGLVTKFMLVPEPACSAVAALAALAALVRARRRGSRDAAR